MSSPQVCEYYAYRLIKIWWSAWSVKVIDKDAPWNYATATDPHRVGRLELSVTLDEAKQLIGNIYD